MKTSIAVFVICLGALPGIGAPAPALKDWPDPGLVVRLWPGAAPGLVAPAKAEEIVNQRIRNVSVPELWVYLPKEKKQDRAALVICPGGAYVHLGMGLHVGNVVKLFNDRDIVVCGLKYRTQYGTNDPAKDAVADGARAIRLLRLHAREWGVDPARIVLQGYSAGANLCLNLLGRFDGGDPAAGDPAERLSSRPDLVALMCLWPQGKSAASYPVAPNPPPVFIAAAEDDPVAPLTFSRQIVQKLQGQGGRIEWFIVPTGGHSAFHYGASRGPGAKWPEALLPLISEWRFR